MLNRPTNYSFSHPLAQTAVSADPCSTELTPPKSLRVLIVTQFYPPDYAATGQLIAELADQLGEWGLNMHIFTGQPGYAFDRDSAPKRERQQQVNVRRSRTSRLWPLRIRGRAINGLLFCLRAAGHLLKHGRKYDLLVLTSEPPYLPILGYLARLGLRLPYVCILYDLYPDIPVALNVVPSQHWLVRLWERVNQRVWRQAQSIVVLSSSMRSRLLRKMPTLCDKIHIIPSWADSHVIVPRAKQDNWFAHAQQTVQHFTVQYSGNLGRCHDLETLLQAIELLRDTPIRFLFIGRGAQLSACIERVQRSRLQHLCRFLPYQEKSVLPYSLTACDLSIVSISAGLEGLVAPSKLYGILAAGRPVAAICEPHSYLRDLIAEAQCGECFTNGDAPGLARYIQELAAHPDRAQALGQAGRHYLDTHYTPKQVALAYWQMLTTAYEKSRDRY
jgi:glycosyltransferase involved in cell wall biosynthesis